MTISFQRPIGASADVAELEFISALHQTELHPRQDASIRAIDIACFLSSRYGIHVTEEEVRETIIRGLGGDDFIDLVEMVSILFIPELAKASQLLFDGPMNERDRQEFDHDWEYEEYIRRCSIMKTRTPDPRMIEIVLGMILNDATGSSLPKRLDRQLVKDIFSAYGEHSLVEKDDIIDEMIIAASLHDDDEEGTVTLDTRAFARALTSDTNKYDVNNETKLSTHYYDVFDTYESTKETSHWSDHYFKAIPKSLGNTRTRQSVNDESEKSDSDEKSAMADEEGLSGGVDTIETRPVERLFTFPAIDYAAGTYSSKAYVVTLWVCGIATYFAYIHNAENSYYRMDCKVETDENGNMTNRGPYFGCRIVNGLVNWVIIMLELSILGTIFICFGSVGNSVFNASPALVLVGMAFVALFTIVPFVVEVETPFFQTKQPEEAHDYFIHLASLVLGCALLVMQIKLLIKILVPEENLKRHNRLSWFLLPNIVIAESNIKQAASFKMSRLLRNALDIHCLPKESAPSRVTAMSDTSYGRALLNFNNHGEKFETIGGVFWAWRGVLAGRMQREEGVFLNSQVVAGNAAQVVVCIFVLVLGISLLVHEIRREPPEDPNAGVYTPERWMAVLSIFIGIMAGFIAAVSITIKTIPSTITTTLQFRSGVLKSLRGDFWIYRVSEDQISLLFGSIFWGAFFTAIAVGIFFGLVVFIAVYQLTRDIFLHFFANVVGLIITLLLKFLVLRFLRVAWYASFYRKQPMKANILNVILQSWNIALATGYMLARTVMLILATMLYIGRIDKPFLAEEAANLGALHLDSYPVAYRKALLQNEAHRHPYIERLGFMYMYKLRYGEGFAKRSGSTWRLLFAFALFPWLRKYRIAANPRLKDDGDIDPDNLDRVGTHRVLPKPPPRYGSIVGGSSDMSPVVNDEDETHPVADQKLRGVDTSTGVRSTEGPRMMSDSTEAEHSDEAVALKKENEALKQKNKELMEKLALMEQEIIA